MVTRIQLSLAFAAVLFSTHVLGDERVSAYLIQVPSSLKTIFIAETVSAKFHRFENRAGAIEYAGDQYMSIGSNGAGKQRAGDKRTPLGAYFVTESLDTSQLHEKYGIVAFPLDYPNAWDRRIERTGDGIWVHGVDPRGGRRPILDTDGCIALPNEELAKILDVFEFNRTPVLITQTLKWSDSQSLERLQKELNRAIDDWASALSKGDMASYLSAYHQDFSRWQMDRSSWSSFAVKTLGNRPIDAIRIDDVLLLEYPGEEGLYLSRFTQQTVEGDKQTTATKRLYWRRDASGVLRIIAESSG